MSNLLDMRALAPVRQFLKPNEPLAEPRYPTLAEAARIVRESWTTGHLRRTSHWNGAEEYCAVGAVMQAQGYDWNALGPTSKLGKLRAFIADARSCWDPEYIALARAIPMTGHSYVKHIVPGKRPFVATWLAGAAIGLLFKVPVFKIVAWNDEMATQEQVAETLERAAYGI